MDIIIGKQPLYLSFVDVIYSITAYSSPSILFGWYIYFFALAILTFKPIILVIDKINTSGWKKVILICLGCLVCRLFCQILFSRLIQVGILRNVCSHYFQWIPVVISGYTVEKDNLFENLYDKFKRISDKIFTLMCIVACVAIYLTKCFTQFIINNYSNVDSLYIPVFMFALIGAVRGCQNKRIAYIGIISPYLWLTHRFLLYPIINYIVLSTRVPLLILLTGLLLMIPIAVIMRMVDKLIERICN